MNIYLPGKFCRLWATALVGAGWLVLMSPSHLVAAQGPATVPATTAYPVLINASGHLTDLFFTSGQCVRKGQVLAKIERQDGTLYYISAPVAGRITASRLVLDGAYLPIHAVLATLEITPPAAAAGH
jgi:biotin carboxyl carrier protein